MYLPTIFPKRNFSVGTTRPVGRRSGVAGESIEIEALARCSRCLMLQLTFGDKMAYKRCTYMYYEDCHVYAIERSNSGTSLTGNSTDNPVASWVYAE